VSGADLLHRLTAAALGEDRTREVLSLLEIDSRLSGDGEIASRAQVAMALNAALYADLLDRVPSAARYAADVRAKGARITFDHGALRTIDGPTGALPPAALAFSRILEPLGYEMAGVYPLPRLHMTGRAFAHRDMPESIPQFFVSELHVAELPPAARDAALRIFGQSRDPLDAFVRDALTLLARDGACAAEIADAALPGLVRAFGCHHDVPRLDDYETLRETSQEAAWIATEGNAFNHGTDRVDDVTALAERLTREGFPMKPTVEHSANGHIHQTAFLADKATRRFLLPDGRSIQRDVPGSFYEFITRDRDPVTGGIDLTFDSGNATGIFAVTRTP